MKEPIEDHRQVVMRNLINVTGIVSSVLLLSLVSACGVDWDHPEIKNDDSNASTTTTTGANVLPNGDNASDQPQRQADEPQQNQQPQMVQYPQDQPAQADQPVQVNIVQQQQAAQPQFQDNATPQNAPQTPQLQQGQAVESEQYSQDPDTYIYLRNGQSRYPNASYRNSNMSRVPVAGYQQGMTNYVYPVPPEARVPNVPVPTVNVPVATVGTAQGPQLRPQNTPGPTVNAGQSQAPQSAPLNAAQQQVLRPSR